MRYTGILVVLAVLFGRSNARAEEAQAQECPRTVAVKDCNQCHGGGLGVVDRKRFEASAHFKKAGMDCDGCHGSSGEFPHGKDEPPACLDCHDGDAFKAIEKMASRSVHSRLNGKAFGCTKCHSPHYAELASEMSFEERNGMCRACHDGDRLTRSHAWHPAAALHLKNTACIACHTRFDAEAAPIAFKHEILSKAEASRACEDCHTKGGKMLYYLETLGAEPRTNLGAEELLKDYYIAGATRVPWLDKAGIALLSAAFLGVVLHGLGRLIARRRKP